MNAETSTRAVSGATPVPTRVALIVTLLVNGAALGSMTLDPKRWTEPTYVAPLLWLFTGLFVLRVTGQVLVALRPRSWLPPMQQWNLIPYPILLPIQIVFILVMVWIDVSFSLNTSIATADNPGFGSFLIAFSAIYALLMVARYVVRMRRRPDQRWFGGTIPIVFHFVLASYLLVLGCFYDGA